MIPGCIWRANSGQIQSRRWACLKTVAMPVNELASHAIRPDRLMVRAR